VSIFFKFSKIHGKITKSGFSIHEIWQSGDARRDGRADGSSASEGNSDTIDVKKRFFRFLFGRVFYVFFIFQTFFIQKNVGKVQSGKQINKKHFQNNSNEIAQY